MYLELTLTRLVSQTFNLPRLLYKFYSIFVTIDFIPSQRAICDIQKDMKQAKKKKKSLVLSFVNIRETATHNADLFSLTKAKKTTANDNLRCS